MVTVRTNFQTHRRGRTLISVSIILQIFSRTLPLSPGFFLIIPSTSFPLLYFSRMSTNNVFSALYPDIWIFPLPTMSDTSPLKKFPYILCLYHYLSFLSHYNTLYENFLSSYCWCSYMGMVSVCCSTSTCDGVETPILGSFTPVYSIITQCEPSEVPRSVHIMGILWLIIKFTIEPLEIRLYSHIKSFTYVFGLIRALKYLLPCRCFIWAEIYPLSRPDKHRLLIIWPCLRYI